ncbi:MAG: TRAP transporter small permease [Anaerovoracaceae bacterium]
MLLEKIESSAPWKALLKIEKTVLMICTLLVFIVLIVSVVIRYVFKSDLYGIEEIIAIVAMWMYMLSASYASYEGSHIKADILDTYVKNQKILALDHLVVEIISALVLGVFCIWGVEYAQWTISSGNLSPYWKFPLCISQVSLSVGLILMEFYSIYHCAKKFQEFKQIVAGGEEN